MSTNRYEMGRRQFLIVSSTALATVAVMPKLFGSEAGGAASRLAVGFASFDDGGAAVDASRVSADGGFISRGVEVGVCGVRHASKNPRDRRAVEVTAHFSVMDGAARTDVPFRAWAASRQSAAQGNVTYFDMPVDETQKVAFSVATERGTPGGAAANRREAFTEPTESATTTLTLSLTGETGSIPLGRGFYIVVPLFAGESDPRWSSYRIGEAGGRWTLVDSNNTPADFEHIILRIDYAPES